MKRKLLLASLVMVVLLGASGCRLPLIDPPIVGKWLVISDIMIGTHYWTFNRDNTGEDYVEIGGNFSYRDAFNWSYKRFDHILTKDGRSYNVEYNFFRTHAVLYDPDDNNKVLELELVSTPIFRL